MSSPDSALNGDRKRQRRNAFGPNSAEAQIVSRFAQNRLISENLGEGSQRMQLVVPVTAASEACTADDSTTTGEVKQDSSCAE